VARASSASRACDYQRKEKKAGRNGKRETATTSGHVCLIPQIISQEVRVREERAIYSAHDRRDRTDRTEQWSNILHATCRRAETWLSCTFLIRGCPEPADGRTAQSFARGAAEQSWIARGRAGITDEFSTACSNLWETGLCTPDSCPTQNPVLPFG
jgi:hypothetical protein